MDFEKKYEKIDIKFVDPSAIHSVEECDWLILKLDQTVGQIVDQINRTKNKRLNPEGLKWRANANRALKGARAVRTALQSRRGLLGRTIKAAHQAGIERAFVDAAIKLLPRQTVHEIWDKVHEDHPQGFSS